jgi:hypothetical protein
MRLPEVRKDHMTRVLAVRRFSLVALALCALCAPAQAGVRMTPGDDAAKQRACAKQCATENAAIAAHAPRVSIAPSDEGAPSAHRGTPACTSSTRTLSRAELNELTTRHPSTPVTPERRNERRARAAPNSSVRAHRPTTQRSKLGARDAPATPGMGTLLRLGASAGREISWNERADAHSPWISRDGRAPPRGPTISTFAQAARPGASPPASQQSARHPSFGAALPSAHCDERHRPSPITVSAAARASVCRGPGFAAPSERIVRSHVGRPGSTAARPHSMLSGGLTP